MSFLGSGFVGVAVTRTGTAALAGARFAFIVDVVVDEDNGCGDVEETLDVPIRVYEEPVLEVRVVGLARLTAAACTIVAFVKLRPPLFRMVVRERRWIYRYDDIWDDAYKLL